MRSRGIVSRQSRWLTWRPSRYFAAFLVASCAVPAYAEVEGVELKPGTEQSARLAPGEMREYVVELQVGQAAELSLRQTDLRALELRWLQPQTLPALRVTAGRHSQRSLMLIADTPGYWRFLVTARTHGQSAAYMVAVGPTHPLETADRRHAAAAIALAKADDLRLASGSAETGKNAGSAAKQKAELAYRGAIAAAVAAGDGCVARQAWSGLARLQLAHVDYPAARMSAQAALAQSCVPVDETVGCADRAEAERTLGSALEYLADYPQAIAAHERALALYRKTDDARFQGVVLGNLTPAYAETGQPGKAANAARAALLAAQTTGDSQGVVYSSERIAALHLARGELSLALDAYRRTLEMLHDTPYPQVENSVWNGLGSLYRQFGEIDQAESAYRKAEAVAASTDDRAAVAEALNNQGDGALDAGVVEDARSLFSRALELARADGLQREWAVALGGLGRCAMAARNWSQARAQLQTAAGIARKQSAQGALISIELALGDLENRQQSFIAARARYASALALARKAQALNLQPVALASLARVELATDAPAAARHDIERALALIETQRTGINAPDLRTSYFASRRAYYELYIEILMTLERQEPDRGHAAAAVQAAERARARALQDQFTERRLTVNGGVDAALLTSESAAEDELHAQAYLLARLPASAAAPRRAAAQKKLDEASRELDALRGRIRQANPRYSELANPVPLSLAEIRSQWLDADTAVLEYWLGDARSYLWLLTREGLHSYVLPPRAEIETNAVKLREAVTRPPPELPLEQLAVSEAANLAEVRRLGDELRGKLLAPIDAALNKHRRVIVADGELQRLPFDLLDFDPGAGNPFDYAYLPSIQTLRWLRDEHAPINRPLALAVFADPVFTADDSRLPGRALAASGEVHRAVTRTAGDAGFAALPRLRHSREEAQLLSGLVPAGASLVALDFAASRDAALKTDWSRYPIVHFATHSLLDLQHPELSGIVLSLFDANGTPQDGFLRMNDLYNLHMPADLVVLSACESALGKVQGSEGVFNLARAFFYAGARRVLASLWTVDDRASAEFMAHFYRALLLQKQTPDEALRIAQKELAADPRWQSPYYWAGYVLQGDWPNEVR